MLHSETANDLIEAIVDMSDRDLDFLIYGASRMAHHLINIDNSKTSAIFAGICVLCAEEKDRRAAMSEHAKIELDGLEMGTLIDDPAEFWSKFTDEGQS